MKSRAVPNREAAIRRAKRMHDRGMSPTQIAHAIEGANVQWVSYHLTRTEKVKSARAEAREKRERRAAKRLAEQLRRRWQREEARRKMEAEKSAVRGRIGDLRDSVDRAFWRVCG